MDVIIHHIRNKKEIELFMFLLVIEEVPLVLQTITISFFNFCYLKVLEFISYFIIFSVLYFILF